MTEGEAERPAVACVAAELNFPTSLVFDDAVAYVVESGLPFDGAPPGGRVWRFDAGERELVAEGLRPPVNGIAVHHGALYVSEGGHPAALTRIAADGTRREVVSGLPGPGDYQVNGPVVGPDRRLYCGQGAMSNLGIVGVDSVHLAWLQRIPAAHDVPGVDVTLTGADVDTPDPRAPGAPPVRTGAFAPFGTPTRPGQRVPAELPATAAVMRCELDGAGLELVA